MWVSRSEFPKKKKKIGVNCQHDSVLVLAEMDGNSQVVKLYVDASTFNNVYSSFNNTIIIIRIVNYNFENWVWKLARTRTLASLCCMLSGFVSLLEDVLQ